MKRLDADTLELNFDPPDEESESGKEKPWSFSSMILKFEFEPFYLFPWQTRRRFLDVTSLINVPI